MPGVMSYQLWSCGKSQEYSFPTEIIWTYQGIPFIFLLLSVFTYHSLGNSFWKATLWEEHSALCSFRSSQSSQRWDTGSCVIYVCTQHDIREQFVGVVSLLGLGFQESNSDHLCPLSHLPCLLLYFSAFPKT